MLLRSASALVAVSFLMACSSGGKTGPVGSLCASNFEPVDPNLYIVDEANPRPTDKDVANKVRSLKIKSVKDLDFSDLEEGRYEAINTMVFYQDHVAGQNKPNFDESGEEKRGVGFKIAAVERPRIPSDPESSVTEDKTAVGVYCVRNFDYLAFKETQKTFRFEMSAIRSLTITKGMSTDDIKYALETSTYVITNEADPQNPDRPFFYAQRVEKDSFESKPSDFFKGGDINGANYTAALYEAEPESENGDPTYQYHAELNLGTHTVQSRVVLRKIVEE
ncbi:MAG: hypothetical protein R2827_01340 [Bdellovibrionales bacterium]